MKIVLMVVLIAGAYTLIYSGMTNQSLLETISFSSTGKKKKNG
jgi:hypothetical protein